MTLELESRVRTTGGYVHRDAKHESVEASRSRAREEGGLPHRRVQGADPSSSGGDELLGVCFVNRFDGIPTRKYVANDVFEMAKIVRVSYMNKDRIVQQRSVAQKSVLRTHCSTEAAKSSI